VGDYPDEEVDHEEDVEREVDLLRRAVCPLLTRLHGLATCQHMCHTYIQHHRPTNKLVYIHSAYSESVS